MYRVIPHVDFECLLITFWMSINQKIFKDSQEISKRQSKETLIYPTYRCTKWKNHEKSSIWNTKPETCRRASILYIETWGKPVQIYPTYRCIKWKIMKSPIFATRNPETSGRLSILYTDMWGKSGHTFHCIKWKNHEKSSFWITRSRNIRRVTSADMDVCVLLQWRKTAKGRRKVRERSAYHYL